MTTKPKPPREIWLVRVPGLKGHWPELAFNRIRAANEFADETDGVAARYVLADDTKPKRKRKAGKR